MSRVDVSDLVGKPFAEFGRGPDAFDCYGLVLEVSRRLGRPFPDYGSLPSASEGAIRRIEERRDEGAFAPASTPAVGDVVLMALSAPGRPDHLGIVTEPGWFLHALPKRGACLSRLALWAPFILGVYRHRPLPSGGPRHDAP